MSVGLVPDVAGLFERPRRFRNRGDESAAPLGQPPRYRWRELLWSVTALCAEPILRATGYAQPDTPATVQAQTDPQSIAFRGPPVRRGIP